VGKARSSFEVPFTPCCGFHAEQIDKEIEVAPVWWTV